MSVCLSSKRYFFNAVYVTTGIVSIVVLGFILTGDIELWVDIGIGDEAKYLYNGVNLLNSNPDPAWGPLYSLWYFFLGLFQKDAISLYYLNYRLITILPCVSLYFFLLKMKVAPALSFYFAFALLISLINLPTWPKVSHFGFAVIFMGLTIINSIKNGNTRILAVFILSLILTYIRPEFILSSLILLGIIIKRIIKNEFGLKHISTAILIIVIFFFLFGIPYSPERNLTAFGQAYHKYLDLSERVDDNGVKDWTEILSSEFGNPESIVDAALNNRDKFMNHIWINLKRIPLIYLNFAETLFPKNIFHVSLLIRALVVLLLILSLFIFILLNKTYKFRKIIFNEFTEKKDLLIFSIIFTLPPLLSILLYFPRAHYILLLLPPIYSLVIQIVAPLKINSSTINLISLCFIIVISFIILPPTSSYYTEPNFKNINAVQSIKNLNISERINLLENEGGLNVYLPKNYEWVKLESKVGSFNEFLDKKKINMIYYSSILNNSHRLRRDSTWFDFLSRPSKFGFKQKIELDGGRIYIKESINSK